MLTRLLHNDRNSIKRKNLARWKKLNHPTTYRRHVRGGSDAQNTTNSVVIRMVDYGGKLLVSNLCGDSLDIRINYPLMSPGDMSVLLDPQRNFWFRLKGDCVYLEFQEYVGELLVPSQAVTEKQYYQIPDEVIHQIVTAAPFVTAACTLQVRIELNDKTMLTVGLQEGTNGVVFKVEYDHESWACGIWRDTQILTKLPLTTTPSKKRVRFASGTKDFKRDMLCGDEIPSVCACS